ncbi:hypothetical protein EJ08DRAFT_126076 [Tothia fuscella]|uniref:RNA exonuclease 4 n=1 Tax=Tothia fuscella TaxID=1048955 RepID=A0A9P4U175_9PEZI|nr:hypothetical protein EJ08DRAFT_126076 [Tothia fuscella]
MAPSDLSQLSSNWKKLQENLKKETPNTEKNLKRKQPEEIPKKSFVKRQKVQTNGAASTDVKMDATARKIARPRSKSIPSKNSKSQKEDQTERPATSLGNHESPISTERVNEGVSETAIAGKYIALDCEMVGFGPTPDDDSQLARVSIVDYHGHQLYDSFVLPQVPVTDYRTHITGITPQILKTGRPFKEVQRDVATFLSGRIVVAHAIKNDLDVLMLSHPKRDIRDTSRHPGFRALSMGKSPKLKKLAKEVLGLEIQEGAHSSVEDARTCMLLFRKEKEAFGSEHAKVWGRPKKLDAMEGDLVVNGAANKKRKKKGKK